MEWFWPSHPDGIGVSNPTCTADGVSCGPRDAGGRFILAEDGGADWRFDLGPEIQLGEGPYHALVLADLGRHDILE